MVGASIYNWDKYNAQYVFLLAHETPRLYPKRTIF
jgi:hypothetical protein